MQTFQGLAVSDGLTVGPVVRIDRGAAGLHRIVCDPFRERALYEAAIVLAKDELNRLQQHACGQDADILMFQIALLEDESFTNEIGDYIAAGAGSAAAVERAEQIFAGRIKNVDDDYIRERSVDVCDACRRVVDILDGRPCRRLHLTERSILAAELVYPSDLFGQAPGMILGLASETDSETSHAAIMARSMGIPAVFQLGKGVAAAAAGCRAVVDAEHAQLIIDPTAAQLRQEGKRDEAIEKLGLKDDVLRRANGFYTYFAADIAYHRNKFAVRGFDKVINIWGDDHHGHVARLKGALDALGLNGSERLDIVLMQLVKLLRDGEVVRMFKRTGMAISLHVLLDEVSVDAARWYFNAKPDTQMEFDLGLAVREDSENHIYYLEYANARICSLLRALETDGVTVPETADLSLLSGEAEKALIKQIAQYCEEIKLAARDYDPSHITRCLQELAACFHRFYTACRIKGEERPVLLARLKLADTARSVLKNAMTLIGCTAPEKM